MLLLLLSTLIPSNQIKADVNKRLLVYDDDNRLSIGYSLSDENSSSATR